MPSKLSLDLATKPLSDSLLWEVIIIDFGFYDLVSRNAVCYRDKDAWFEVESGQSLTFSQYKERVDRLAYGLQQAGIKKGDRVGVLGKNSLEYFLLFGAAAALGAIMLPINWRLSPDEVEFNLNDCTPRLVFVDKGFQDLIQGLKGRLSSVERYYNLNQEGGDFLEFDSLMEIQDDFRPEETSTDDGFVIIHTAAVEGRPRGALLSHGNILLGNMHFNYLFNLNDRDVHLNFLPLFHAGGLYMVTSSFHIGALNLNMSQFDAVRAVELIEEKKVSLLMEFSPMLSSMLEQSEKTGKDMSSLRAVAGIDSPEIIEKYQQVTGGRYYCLYGQTETSCVVTYGAFNERPG
ncbi:MAG: AMP-binding protein, partial [Deltaproteobacteria bacterium]|nr:AMP-binding protein [Deltaproteobacteria bacterium]